MIYTYVAICVVLYLFFGADGLLSLGVCEGNMSGAFTYQFAHASLLHLIVNSLCLCLMYKPIERLCLKRFSMPPRCFFLSVFFCSVAAAFPAATITPTVGGSGLVFVLLGMLLVLNPTKKQLQSYIYVALAVLIQLYFKKSNVALHACAFIAGALFIIGLIAYDRTRIHIEE